MCIINGILYMCINVDFYNGTKNREMLGKRKRYLV